jgi:transcriptional regulator with XRE-family HTH domain
MIPAQCRAARALLNWSQSKLAKAAALGLSTVVDFERERRSISDSAKSEIEAALRTAGVIFVAENGEGPGVRLRKKHEDQDTLTREIDEIEGELATSDGEPPKTPEGGMQRLERAHKRETVKKLKNKRTKLVKVKK